MSDVANTAGEVHGNLVQAGVINGDVVLHQNLRVEPGDLDRARLRAEGWASAEQRLTAYLRAAVQVAVEHPYPGVLPGTQPPALSEVYLEQLAEGESFARVPAEVVFHRQDDCVVDGGPGSGKSSLLRMGVLKLVDLLAAGRDGAQVPVRILASDLLADRPFGESLAAATRADFGSGAMRGFSPEFFSEPPVAGGRWLVMVDGLDEVVGVGHRGRVLRRLARIAHDHNDTHRLLVATRPMLSDDLRQVGRWQRTGFRLQAFGRYQLPAFARSWFDALRVPDPEGLARRFTASIDRMGLGSLAATPLMATMLCQLFAARPEAELPTGRREVYLRFTELLYGRVLAGPPPTEQAVLGLREAHLDLARTIAKRRQEGVTTPTVELLADLTASRRPPGSPEPRWRDLVVEVMQSTGLFAPHRGDLKFIHQTIAEFLAAEHVAIDPRRGFRARIELFGWAHNRNPTLAATRSAHSAETEWNDNSYLRFLLGAWLANGYAPARIALSRMARRGGANALEGIRLFADLAADGVDIGDGLRKRMTRSLRALAEGETTRYVDRCAAAKLLSRHGDPRGQEILHQFALNRRLHVAARVHAAVELEERGTWLLLNALSEPLSADDRLVVLNGLGRVDPAEACLRLRALAGVDATPVAVRAEAAVALVRLGDPAGHRIALRLGRTGAAASFGALATLIELAGEDRKTRARLLEVLSATARNSRSSPESRYEAASALLSVERRAALQYLAALARATGAPAAWRMRAAALRVEAMPNPEVALLLSTAQATWHNLDADLRERVERLLRRHGAWERFPFR
ncbi:hypothetical protein SUDANB95_02373 [Actinosynnema sp. ALI-1.44]